MFRIFDVMGAAEPTITRCPSSAVSSAIKNGHLLHHATHSCLRVPFGRFSFFFRFLYLLYVRPIFRPRYIRFRLFYCVVGRLLPLCLLLLLLFFVFVTSDGVIYEDLWRPDWPATRRHRPRVPRLFHFPGENVPADASVSSAVAARLADADPTHAVLFKRNRKGKRRMRRRKRNKRNMRRQIEEVKEAAAAPCFKPKWPRRGGFDEGQSKSCMITNNI